MNIVIVEDEQLTAEYLKDIIESLKSGTQVVKILRSVKEAVQYFQHNTAPDLIFSDIQLGDGLSFDIYSQIELNRPIIFCTAYDEYALNAFEAKGIHYVLKPFDENKIAEALDKFEKFKLSFQVGNASLEEVLNLLKSPKQEKPRSVLVYQHDKVIPVKFEDISLFFIKNEVTHLITFKGKIYNLNKSLDEVQQQCDDNFFRANRQFIVSKNAVKEVSQTLSRKVSVTLNIPFEGDILVSKEKMTDFLNWLKE